MKTFLNETFPLNAFDGGDVWDSGAVLTDGGVSREEEEGSCDGESVESWVGSGVGSLGGDESGGGRAAAA